ncbi:SAM-dependent methyltransferase [uncultured Treponema sp.]|uniref:SAM-dependent methyltransferase n=1 Tax=uncultured Treponema sp. TaxID=162155 RepID=UPI00259A4593|nr:SAM-dependent methyltransferase [uncultured Treponema sp.]
METALYLIPVPLGETPVGQVLPAYNAEIIRNISVFIVENVRSARRFLKKADNNINIDDIEFYELNEHTNKNSIGNYLDPIIKEGKPMGVISEAGCPAVADPGADIVALAQKKNIRVIPLVGPSSILMSVMASGFSGQSFAFNGYLPAKPQERAQKLKQLEQRCYKENQTQLFIETPYRNAQMIESILKTCRPETKLCIASGITCPEEYIKTKSVAEWKKSSLPELGKIPAVFLIYKG